MRTQANRKRWTNPPKSKIFEGVKYFYHSKHGSKGSAQTTAKHKRRLGHRARVVKTGRGQYSVYVRGGRKSKSKR